MMRRGSYSEMVTVLVGSYIGGVVGMLVESGLSSAMLVEHLHQIGLVFLRPLNWHIGYIDIWLVVFAVVGAVTGGLLTLRWLQHWLSRRS